MADAQPIPFRDSLSAQRASEIYRDPYRLIYDPDVRRGYMRINSDTQVVNGRIVQGDTEERKIFSPRFEQAFIIAIRKECRRRQRPTKMIVAKARDVGLSAGTAFPMVAEMACKPVASLNCLTLTRAVLNDPVRKYIVLAAESLPSPLTFDLPNKKSFQMEYRREGDFPAHGFINLFSAESGNTTGVGTRAGYHWISEYAKFPKNHDIMRTFRDTLLKGVDAWSMKESTCEGKGNLHWEEFDFSWQLQGNVNPDHPDFRWDSGAPEIAIMFPWFYADDRLLPLVKGVTPEMVLARMDEYEEEQYRHPNGVRAFIERHRGRLGLKSQGDIDAYCAMQFHYMRCYSVGIPEFRHYTDPESRYHYPIGQIARAGPKRWSDRKKEAPWNVDEAFADDASAAFTDAEMAAHKDDIAPPLIGYVDAGKFVEAENGWMKLWLRGTEDKPSPESTRRVLHENKGFPRILLFTAADFAQGDNVTDKKTNFSASTGWTTRLEQVYEISERVKSYDFRKMLLQAHDFVSGGRQYREPFECIEYGSLGMDFVQARVNFDHPERKGEYTRFYFSYKHDGKMWKEDAARPGFWPNAHQQNVAAWLKFKELWVKPGAIVARSQMLFDQVKTLAPKVSQNGRHMVLEAIAKGTELEHGSQDDLPDTLKMVAWHREMIMGEKSDISEFVAGVDPHGAFTKWEYDELNPYSEEARRMRDEELDRRINNTRFWAKQSY